jgi:ubiquinone/menaquinone biosynthesis C-methylase UbiE
MELSSIEFKAMNNPIKELIDKYHDFRIYRKVLARNGIDLDGKMVLEAGCGSGYNLKLLLKTWQPKKVYAFDYMPEQVELAEKRGLQAHIFVGDITAIDLPSDKFDMVIVIGVFHHVPEWRKALREVHRVLKTGGVLLTMELHKRFLDLIDRFAAFGHPVESRFDWPEFTDALHQTGFSIIDRRNLLPFSKMFRIHLCNKDGSSLYSERQLDIPASVKG